MLLDLAFVALTTMVPSGSNTTASDTLDDVPAAAPRRRAGIGLLAGAGAANVASFGLRLGAWLSLRACERQPATIDGAFGCLGLAARAGAMQLGALGAASASVGLAAGGGALLGQAGALDDRGRRRRSHRQESRAVGTGTALVVVGASVVLATGLTSWFAPFDCSSRCLTAAYGGLQLGAHVGWTGVAAGAAILARSGAYNRWTLRFSPQFARGQLGIGVSGRF